MQRKRVACVPRKGAGDAPRLLQRSMRPLPIIILLSLLLCSLASCLSDEDVSTSPDDRLYFSADSVAFDTIVSGMPTGTVRLPAYNPPDKTIALPSVYLEGGAGSAFKVNVDGTPLAGGSATDFEVMGKDSIMIYLFANTPQLDTDEPVRHEDRLVFQTGGGAVQKVKLTATGQSVINLPSTPITDDRTLDAARPYRIKDSLVVAEGATLTLPAGARLYFHGEARLIVYGTLLVLGTLDKPVVMRGDRFENMFEGQPYDRVPGQWGGVTLKAQSYGNYINYLDLHSSKTGLTLEAGDDLTREKLVMENSILHNATNNCFTATMANIYVGNCQITNAGGNCVELHGGDNTFAHCTIARFYPFTGGYGVALDFSNYLGEQRTPLERLDFINCIVTGNKDDDIMGNHSAYTEDAFEYRFFNCLLNTPPYADERLVDCLWDGDGRTSADRAAGFEPAFDDAQLIYKFNLSPTSRALNKANAELSARTYPEDRLGKNRLADEAPDMGCYERQAGE